MRSSNYVNSESLTILITNHHLINYTGSEVYTFYLAKKLKEKGHNPIVYSSYICNIDKDFENENIPITNSLESLKNISFDVAHVHHSINAIEVRNAFPDLPIVFVSHGVLPFLEHPPVTNVCISRYIAVSEEVRANLLSSGIQGSRINIIRNIIDPERFRQKRPINKTPKSLLVISARIDDLKLKNIYCAAKNLSMKVKVVGGKHGEVNQVEIADLIQSADIVFSLGRGVVEAIFSGRIPFVYDYLGGDGLITPDNFDESIKCNFSGRRYKREFSVKELTTELIKYNQNDIDLLQKKAFKEFDSGTNVDALIKVYRLSKQNEISCNEKDIKTAKYIASSLALTRGYSKQLLDQLYSNNKILENKKTPLHIENYAYDISIIIPLFNNYQLTEKCLESIYRHTKNINFEIVLVDNGSTDETHSIIEQYTKSYPNIKAIINGTNTGFSSANNIGVKVSKGKYVLLLNNDTIVTEKWLPPLIEVLDNDENVAAVGAKLIFDDDSIQHAGVAIINNKITGDPLVAEHVYYKYNKSCECVNIPMEYQAITGACFLVRKSLYIDANGLDENFWNGYEDIDLCFKLRKMGFKLVYQPYSVVYHLESQSGSERFKKAHSNIKLLHKKWLGLVTPDLIINEDGSEEKIHPGIISRYSPPKFNYNHKVMRDNNQIVKCQTSIVILTFNQLEYTKLCVESIIKFTPEPHEIIFVDNGSSDGTVRWLKTQCIRHQNYRLIRNKTNKGFAAGCNQGIEAAYGEYILLLNNDVIVTPNWLTGMLNCLNSDIKSGIVGPMTNNISGPQRVPRVAYESLEDMPAFAERFFREHRHRRIPYQRIVGFCMLFRRTLVDRIGLLDPSFGTGNFEDDDFCLRAALHGHRNYIAADVFFHHFGSQSFIGNGIDYNGVLNNNRNLFLDKWNAIPGDDPLYEELFTVNRIQKVEQLIHMGLCSEAEKHLLDGIRRFPERPELVCHLAGLLAEENRHEDALKLLDALPPRHLRLEGLRTKGFCHEALGQLPEADTIADQLLRLDQAESYGWNLKGVIAYKQGHVAEAESCFRKAIDSDPAYAEPYANLGIVCWENDAQDKALPFFARSFILAPTSVTNAANYHAAAVACGAIDQARSDFFEAGALFPLNKQIAFLHIDLLIRQGNHQAAIDAIENAILLFGVDGGMLKAALDVRRHIGPVCIEPARSSGPTVSLCMIVKNEQAYLAACLQSLKPIVNEIIVVDTGSTDATRDIAEIFGARVFAFTWDDDFSAARNYSLVKATGDWILVMDADEVIAPRDHRRLTDLVRKTPRNKPAAYVMTTRNYTVQQDSADYAANTGDYREEKGPGWVPSRKVRLFRNHQEVRFVFPVHEQVDPVLDEMGVPLVECAVPVHHYGKLDAERTSQRWKMYYEIGKAKLSAVGSNPLALKELAVQAALLSKWKESAGYWEKLLALQPDSVEACLNLTRVLAKSGDFDRACEYARQALQGDAGRIETHYNLVLSQLQTGAIADAAQTAARMVDDFPADPDANLLCVIAELIAGDTSQGSHRLHKLAATVAPKALLQRVRSLVAALRSAGRDAWIDSLVDALAGIDALRDIAGQIAAIGRHKTVASAPAETLSKLFRSAVRHYEREDYPTAFEALSQIIAAAPDHWSAYDLLVNVMVQAGQENAIPEQLHHLEMRSDLPADMLALIGSGYEATGDIAQAAAYVDRALEVDPDCARAWSLKGVLAFRNQDKAAAADHFKRAVAHNAAWGEPWTNLGIVLWEQNDRDDAIPCLEKGLNLSPTAPNVATTYHAVVSETGQYDRARKRFEKAIEGHPDFRRARFLLIDILIRLEAYAAALSQIEAVLVRFGADPQLLQAAKSVRDKAGPMTIAKGKHPSLSLCMIVKNEAQHLPRCLESLKPLVDEMIVVDTGSTDATREIAEVFGAQVFAVEWQDDFAAARNHSLERASGDWILVMDADEIIAPSDHQAIRNLIRKHQRDKSAFLITTRNYTHKYNGIGWEANDGRYNCIEAGCGWIPSTKTRLFKKAPSIRFEYPVHELVDPALERKGYQIKPFHVPVHHYGFLDQSKVNQKGKHYHVIGKKKLQQMNDDPKAIQELAAQANLYGEPQEAILLWNRLAELQPDNVKTFINLSAAHGKSGDYDQAKSAALKAVAIDPSAREGHLNLGRSDFFLGNFVAARNVFAELVRSDKSYYAGLFMLAAAHICCGNSPKGLSALQHLQTVDIWSSLPQAFQELAHSLTKAGFKKQADGLIHFADRLHAEAIVPGPASRAEFHPSADSASRLSLAS